MNLAADRHLLPSRMMNQVQTNVAVARLIANRNKVAYVCKFVARPTVACAEEYGKATREVLVCDNYVLTRHDCGSMNWLPAEL
jgi:hypothetical protein